MEIPMITKFINGLKMFFESKRLKWLTIVFFVGAVLITLWEQIGSYFAGFGLFVFLIWGIFPTFFMLTFFVSLAGFQRFVASEESYQASLIRFIPWIIASGVLLFMLIMFAFPIFSVIYIGIAFVGWIGFQSYFSARTSLTYASGVQMDKTSKLTTFLFGFANVFNYVIIIGAFVYTVLFVNAPILLPPYTSALFFGILGMLLALGFNFLNGVIVAWERNKPHAMNIVLLSIFISLYSAYFTYNVLKGFQPGIDLVSLAVTVFFILYTMSSVGQTLSSRADMDTRWKISKEAAATLTFFLASGFMFVDVTFSILAGPTQGGLGDGVKLLIFPLIALLMEIRFIYKVKKAQQVPETPKEMEVVGVEEQVEERPPEEGPPTEEVPPTEEDMAQEFPDMDEAEGEEPPLAEEEETIESDTPDAPTTENEVDQE
jgi:hypothetical protein